MNESGKILVLNYKFNNTERLLALLISGNRLKKIKVCEESELMDIYKGKVVSVSKPINACFVNYKDNKQCFLSLDEKKDIKAGDELTIQIVREAMGSKLPTATLSYSIPGKHLILAYNRPGVNFSGKLSMKEKHSLKHLLSDTAIFTEREDSPFGVILRTNAASLTDSDEIVKEYESLKQKMEEIAGFSDNRTCFSLLYKDENEYLKFINDTYDNEYDEIITDDSEIYKVLQNSGLQKSVRLYDDDRLSLSKLYSLDSRISEALGSRIWLKSGGWISIQSTNALTAIDVNSGKFEGKNKNQNEMIAKTNKEAADEIMNQLILRNLSGIIVVDFINIKDNDEIKDFMGYLKELARKDPVKCEIVDMTKLGLVEITRKKISKTLREQFGYETD
ncbi:MAG: ribonuclease E/G [Lachnospiraceae bacterium]|nr:ribonuclease E/G [Lachnospiraceae bacterium]